MAACSLRRLLPLLVVSFTLSRAAAAEPEKPRLDAFGDPLPRGVTARLGTGRLLHGEVFLYAAFSPDGKLLATCGDRSGLHLWDVKSGRELHSLNVSTGNKSFYYTDMPLAFSPDGKRLALGSVGGIYMIDPATGQELFRATPGQGTITNLAFDPNGHYLALGGQGTLGLWDLDRGKVAATWGEFSRIFGLGYSPDGKALSVVANLKNDGHLLFSVRDVVTGRERLRQPLPRDDYYSGMLAPDGQVFALPAPDGKSIRLFDPTTGKELRRTEGEANCPDWLSFSADGKYLTSSSWDKSLRVWEVASGKLVQRIKGMPRGVARVALTRDGGVLAFTCWPDQALHLLDVAKGQEIHSFAGHRSGQLAVTFSADGKTVATTSRDWHHTLGALPWADWSLRLWDPLSGRELQAYPRGQGNEVHWTVFSPDGSRLATVTWNGKMRLWDVGSGQLLREWQGPLTEIIHQKDGKKIIDHHLTLTAVVFADDGKYILALDKKKVHRWEVDTGKELSVVNLPVVWDRPHCLAQPNGRTLLVTDQERFRSQLVLVDLQTGKEVRRFAIGDSSNPALAGSPDGRTVAIGDRGHVSLWEPAAGVERGRWEHSSAWDFAAAFSPDGKTLALGGDPLGVLRLWHLPTGVQVSRSIGYPARITSLAFSPNGSRLAVGGYHNTAVVCDVAALLGELPANREPANLERLWGDLAGRDGVRAFLAMHQLAAAGPRAVAFLRGQLKKAVPADPKRLARLLVELDDEDFQVREQAAKELERLGEGAAGFLKDALRGQPPAEVRGRVQRLLDRLSADAQALVAPELAGLRVVEVLEHNGGREARQFLAELAQEADTPVARDAKMALARLVRQHKETSP